MVKLFLLLLKENKYHNIHLEICISLFVFTAKLIILEMENPCEPIQRLWSHPDLEKMKKTFARKFHTEGSNSIPRASKGPQKAKRRLPRQGVQINSICIYAVSSHILVLIYIIQT